MHQCGKPYGSINCTNYKTVFAYTPCLFVFFAPTSREKQSCSSCAWDGGLSVASYFRNSECTIEHPLREGFMIWKRAAGASEGGWGCHGCGVERWFLGCLGFVVGAVGSERWVLIWANRKGPSDLEPSENRVYVAECPGELGQGPPIVSSCERRRFHEISWKTFRGRCR